jgi:hypothetical protein
MLILLYMGAMLVDGSSLLYLHRLINKAVLIHPSAFPELTVAAKRGSLDEDLFGLARDSSGHNIKSRITVDGDRYQVEVGDHHLCIGRHELIACGSKPDNWEISKENFGFKVSQRSYCLTARGRLSIEICSSDKGQLFDFEDYEIEDCLDNIDLDGKPATEAERRRQLRLQNKIKGLEKSNPQRAKRLLDKAAEKNDFNKYMKKRFPNIEDKPKSKKIAEGLWNNGWRPKLKWNGFPWKFKFCKKLW